MKRLFLILFLGTPLLACLPAQAQAPKLDVVVKDAELDHVKVFEVAATIEVKAAPAAVWRILTAYERMPEFVPDLESAKVLERSGNELTVEQFGTAHFLFLSHAIHLVVRVTEQPMTAIDITLVSGDMKHYACRWELWPVPDTGGTRVVYRGKLMPSFYVPGMLGAHLVHKDVTRMMAGLLTRLERPDEAGAR